jgi:hypothetical protein
MRRFRLGALGIMLGTLLAGCDGGAAVETTMPTTPTTVPPEIEQMKNEMQKRLPQLNRYGHKAHRSTAGNRS